MDVRKPATIEATGLMMFITLTWGLQQVAIKYIAPEMAPVFQIGIRSALAGLFLILFIFLRKYFRHFHKQVWMQGITVGILFSLEYLSVGEGLKYTTAAHMIIFLYTTPVFAAVGLNYFLPEEKLDALQWAGIAIAFLAIIIAFYSPNSHHDHNSRVMLFGDMPQLLGGLCWGATTVLIRTTKLSRCPASQTLLYQLFSAFVILSALTVILQQTHIHWSWRLFLSLGFQSIILCFISFLLWFWLLRVYLATQLSILSLIRALFGIAFGVILLNASLTYHFIVGTMFVLIGIFIVSNYPGRRIKYKD